MHRMLTIAVVAMLTGAIGLRADEKTAARWFSHVEALANDGMEGRNTGSPGHKRAADYVTAQFQKAGLAPAGVGGEIPPVRVKARPLAGTEADPPAARDGRGRPAPPAGDGNTR